MTQPSVALCSMWQNDEARSLVDRVEHLLAKQESWPNLRYVWLVGDSSDGTAQALAELSAGYGNVRIAEITTGIMGDDADSRLRRLSATANRYFDRVDGADYILLHESDLLTPYNLVPKLVGHAESGRCPIAGWPTLEITPGQRIFYDIFCYRKDGRMFGHTPPYHACYRADAPFVVDSAGSVLMIHGEDAPLIHMSTGAVLDLCKQLRQVGRTIWVDPALEIVQPHSLWQWHSIPQGEYA